MSFFASNSRIRVLDASDTVFDTNENMPHIVGTATVTANVSYGNISATQVYWYSTAFEESNAPYCSYNSPYCTYSPTPPTCYPVWCWDNPPYCQDAWCFDFCFSEPCFPAYCPPPYCSYNPPYCPEPYCSYNSQTAYCNPTTDYCVYNFPYTYYVDTYMPRYTAREVSTDTNIADLPNDENGNPISIDFIVIQASGSRTVAGTDARIQTSFQTSVPAGTFSFQGSALLESSARDDGSFWLRRIISLFVNNTTKKVVLRKQETVGARDTYDYGTGGEASSYSFSFKLFFGRFKS